MPRLAVLVSTLAIGGCGASAVPVRLAVLPVAWQTRDAFEGLDERAPLTRGLASVEAVSVVDVAPEPPCGDDAECARAAARTAGADRAVAASMASLGDTVIARVSVIDVRAGTREETRQRVVQEGTEARVREALVELGAATARGFAPAAAPLWEEAWVWIVGGSALAGAAVAIALAVALGGSGGPDHVVTPP